MFVRLLNDFLGGKPGERIDVSEADANALIAQLLATPVPDDLITPAVQKAMEQAFNGFQKRLDAVINTALKQREFRLWRLQRRATDSLQRSTSFLVLPSIRTA